MKRQQIRKLLLLILLLFLPALLSGRRAACHYLCWMSPFMIIGSAVGRKLHLPQLHVEADKTRCVSCKQCSKVCPMGLDVQKMVQEKGGTVCSECIQCGSCIDQCPNKVLHYTWKWKKS